MADVGVVRSLLREDRPWSVYALGDLDPRRAQYCDWYVRGRSVALLYREFGTPILFAAGEPEVIAELPELDACLLQVPEHFLGAIEQRLELEWTCPVIRMAIDAAKFKRDSRSRVDSLGPADEHALRELYEDGHESGEEPDFFIATQLEDSTFCGIRDQGRLVAAGGTHLYSASESVGAIGNVYTRRSHRGRGHGNAVVSAIVQQLIERGTETIGLNVRAANAGAIRLYERLGFRVHVGFYEGRAVRRTAKGSRL